jgi:hypothetical protein
LRCEWPRFSSRTTLERRLRQPTVNGFGRESAFNKGSAMLIRGKNNGIFGRAAVRTRIPTAPAPTLLPGGLLLLIGP